MTRTANSAVKFKAAVHDFGTRLLVDPELAGKVNAWIGDAAGLPGRRPTARTSPGSSRTPWPAGTPRRPPQKIELQVGRDLQFIRINGTVVGALAGLAIFTLATLLFG